MYSETLFRFRSNVNNVNSVSVYGAADTEQHTLFMFSGYSQKRLYRVTWRR